MAKLSATLGEESMSRIGKKSIVIPAGVKATVSASVVSVEAKNGRLNCAIPAKFKVEVKDNIITVMRPSDTKQDKATHGLIRSLINNNIRGVLEGYKKELEITGVGFKAQVQGKVLNITLSYSHPINFNIPDGITIETPKPNLIMIKGIDKAKVGEVAAEIRDYYRPEPYKGKGIKYIDEHVRRKAGKAVAGAGGTGAK